MSHLEELSPQAFCAWLSQHDITRFFLVWNETEQRVDVSHRALQPLADLLQADGRDYLRHEGIFVQVDPDTGVLQGAFVHRTCRGQAAGGVRFWAYDTIADFLRDGLRLATGMMHKNALAGLWWGGGKGVMVQGTGQHDPAVADAGLRRRIYQSYGGFMSDLKGCYVTAEDVGTSVEDMAAVFSRTRFTTCIPAELGGSGNPSAPTARGVVCAMEAALHHLGLGDLRGKSVAVQGVGHVGEPLISFLIDKGVARIVGSDIDPSRKAALEARYGGGSCQVRVELVPRGDNSVLAEHVDIVAPCATGAVLKPDTIATIHAKIVCGAANNQLEDAPRDAPLLHARGITYVSDFLANRMGIVTCADECSGYVEPDPIIERHLSRDWQHGIWQRTLAVLGEAEASGRTPDDVAREMAERLSLEINPIYGHRGAQIVRSLARTWTQM